MQGQQEKKYFNSEDSLLNADDAPFVVSPNAWVNLENLRFQTTDKNYTGQGQFIGGTQLLSTPQPSINYITIGGIGDDENSRLINFKFNTTGRQDKITCYYSTTGIEYDVLLSSQVTGGLNFSKNSLIHSAAIINGLLHWVDGINNQPRKINIESAIKANNPSFVTDEQPYTFPLNFSEITIIKPPPILSPNIIKDTDGTYNNNFIANESLEFAFEYGYYDNEETVLGSYSPASKLNFENDTFNRIIVTMDSIEFVPLTVRFVNLIVRFGNSNNARVIKTWDREVASESAEIDSQNNALTPLTFNFYNDISGVTVPPQNVLKPFDNVPVFSQTMSAAKNRIFLGNNIEGYDTPLGTSMQLALGDLINMSIDSQLTPLWVVRITSGRIGSPYGYSAYYVRLNWANPAGFYEIISTASLVTGSNVPPALPPAPTTTSFTTGISYKGTNINEIISNVRPPGYQNGVPDGNYPATTGTNITLTGINIGNYAVFAQNSPYRAGVVFLDFAGRRCSVVTNDGLILTTPFRNFDYTTAYTSIDWVLSNANAVDEIPDWAYYYIPVLTLNQRTRFFIQGWSLAPKYATKDVDGNYVYSSTVFLPNTVAIALDTTSLIQDGLGYVYNGDSNDQSIFILSGSGNRYELPIIGQDGNYILLKAKDLGNLNGITIRYEIYTPYKTSDQELFFDMGNVYQILNPGTVNRQYLTLEGSLPPDAFAITRSFNNSTYIAGAMCPNDLFYARWDNDGGKVNVVTKLGQVRKTQYIRWGDTFIPNTSVNGLSTFDVLNEISIPEDCGSLTKLINTSKVQSEGTVMLALCANETNSVYLGETPQIDATGQTLYYTQTKGVISALNTLKGSFGTVNPESVVSFRGSVFWFSAFTGKIVQYASNGLFPISNYKMVRFWNLFSNQYLSMTTAEIEALGSRPYVFGIVDPYHNELLFSIPKLLADPPKGYLPDYPNQIYPFDIYDGRAKTIVYKLDTGEGRPKWLGSFTFSVDFFVTLQNELYSMKNGLIYLHNQQNFNEFYGVQNSSKLMVVANQLPTKPKLYDNISSQSNLVPSFVYFYNEDPVQQSSDLVDLDFTEKEGVFFSTIKRNKLVPTVDGYTTDGLLTGEKLRNAAMFIMFEWRVVDEPLELKFVNIGYSLSRGIPT